MSNVMLNPRRYLPGELQGIESAHRRGYVATRRFDDDLALDWYGICEEEGMPFVQCAQRKTLYVVDFDLTPFLRRRPELAGLNEHGVQLLTRFAERAFKVSSRSARIQVHDQGGLLTGLARDQAHQLAQRIHRILCDMALYQEREDPPCLTC